MADMLASIQQHEPLRVPAGWDKQERAMLMQLEEILDDIYRRFGRLRLEDMGKSFRKEFADAEGNIATLQADTESISAQVRDKYDKVSGIDITSAGVSISGSKYIMLNSGSEGIVYNDGELIIGKNTSIRPFGAKLTTYGYDGFNTESAQLELSVYNGVYGVRLGMLPMWDSDWNDYVSKLAFYPMDSNMSYVGFDGAPFSHGYIKSVYANRIEPIAVPSKTSAIGIDTPFYSISGTTIRYTYLVQNSSRRMKRNIRDLESCGGIIDKLQPVRYNYISDKKERLGLIYEDTVDLLPEVCLDDGKQKGINYVELVPVLLREIKDLRDRVAELERSA